MLLGGAQHAWTSGFDFTDAEPEVSGEQQPTAAHALLLPWLLSQALQASGDSILAVRL